MGSKSIEDKKMNIIFDIDDTIYNLMEPFALAHEETYAAKTVADCEELFKASRKYSDEAFYMQERGEIKAEEEFAYRIVKTYADVGIEVTMDEAKHFEERYRYHQNHIHVPKGMEKILDDCKEKKITIGALTNGKKENQGKKIEILGLKRWFEKESLYISGEIGASKPDVRAFLAVQEGLKLKPEETWFIGDTFEVDVAGAKNAGWHVIWFNHRKRPMPEGNIVPDMEVNTIEQLHKAIMDIEDR